MDNDKDLAAENAALKRELDALRAQAGVPEGALVLPRGTKIHYVRGDEKRCRPATVLSDGVCDRMQAPPGHPHGGNLLEYVYLAYGDVNPRSTDERPIPHTFETTRYHHPGGFPDTWHLIAECPFTAQAS